MTRPLLAMIALAMLLSGGCVQNASRKPRPRPGIITTVAGDGWEGHEGIGRFAGDGGLATRASLSYPAGIALGPDGSIFIADARNDCVRKVDAFGIITTVAGNGTNKYTGDGGPAIRAGIRLPQDVACGPDGSIYIADGWNNTVRQVSSSGTITTLAGNGHLGYSGDGHFVAKAELHLPESVALAADGSLYISDSGNHRIRKVTGVVRRTR